MDFEDVHYYVFKSASSVDEGWLSMILALKNSGQSRTMMCLIESGSLHWLQSGHSSCLKII